MRPILGSMYYHCRELKYVLYAKVFPPPRDSLDKDYLPAYQWLGQYCGFSPQIWLSRSTRKITGMRNRPDNILFGFENVQGFPVRYDVWCHLLNPLINGMRDNKPIEQYLRESLEDALKEDDELDEVLKGWQKSRSLDEFLQRNLFVEHDQVVVPSLNLRSAKKIICRTERQKKTLRKMGFIEDRVEVRNLHIF